MNSSDSQSETCNENNEEVKIEANNKDINFLDYLGEEYKILNNTVNSLESFKGQEMINVMLIGHSNSKIRDLASVVAGNPSRISFVAVNQIKTEFDIFETDNNQKLNRMKSDTIITEEKYMLWHHLGYSYDNSIDEIIGKYSTRVVLNYSKKIKIVIVISYNQVKSNLNENDLLTTLKRVCELFSGVRKYRHSLYFIVTDVDSTVATEKSVTKEIMEYVKNVLKGTKNPNKAVFSDEIIMDITAILSSDSMRRIKIFRKPHKEGLLSNDNEMMYNRNEIRDWLLNDNNIFEPQLKDFNISLSDSAKSYLQKIVEKMNLYSHNLSKTLTHHVISNYNKTTECKVIFENIENSVNYIVQEVKKFHVDTKDIKNSYKYIFRLHKFSDTNKLNLEGNENFKRLFSFIEFLNYLGIVNDLDKLTIGFHNGLLNLQDVITFFHNKLRANQYAWQIFEYLTSYENQRVRENKHLILIHMDEKFKINLPNENTMIVVSSISTIDDIDSTFVRSNPKMFCEDNTGNTIIYNNVVVLSLLNLPSYCPGNKTLLLAFHTIFIDIDLMLTGNDLTIIAPKWVVIGNRKISLDGISDMEMLPKADVGDIGRRGQNGSPGGNFGGMGMIFVNDDHLIISTNGDDGYDGQDGGDGHKGTGGGHGFKSYSLLYKRNESFNNSISSKFRLPSDSVTVEKYIAEGEPGNPGGDSGEGGDGGFGGLAGGVVMRTVNYVPKFKFVCKNGNRGKKGKNGIPGEGGLSGRNSYYYYVYNFTSSTTYLLADKYNYKRIRAKNGSVRKSTKQEISPVYYADSNILCKDYIKFLQYYYDSDGHKHFSDGITKQFINEIMKK